MEEALLNIVVTINSYLSNYVLIILLIGAASTSPSERASCRFAASEKAGSAFLAASRSSAKRRRAA